MKFSMMEEKMKIDKALKVISNNICKNIEQSGTNSRGYLSQNILKSLRDLVEHTSLKVFSDGKDIDINYDNIQKANKYVKQFHYLSFLYKFHNFLRVSTSHYMLDEGSSERLMLKYYEYLVRIKNFLREEYSIEILHNLDNFPLVLDSHLSTYYEKIVDKIENCSEEELKREYDNRYYITKIKPFFVSEEVYYEITFTLANDNVSKFDRIIAFTKNDLIPNYAVKLWLKSDVIEVLGKAMPIRIITSYEVSIRPCEFNNLGRIFSLNFKISSNNIEYKKLMSFISKTGMTLNELVSTSQNYYEETRNVITSESSKIIIFDLFDKCRKIIANNLSGANVLIYLLYKMNNKIIKAQINSKPCYKLSDLYLDFGCIPFDEMPFTTSLKKHNPRLVELFSCLDVTNREHELFVRVLKNNIEMRAQLFTLKKEIVGFENINNLIKEPLSKFGIGLS